MQNVGSIYSSIVTLVALVALTASVILTAQIVSAGTVSSSEGVSNTVYAQLSKLNELAVGSEPSRLVLDSVPVSWSWEMPELSPWITNAIGYFNSLQPISVAIVNIIAYILLFGSFIVYLMIKHRNKGV